MLSGTVGTVHPEHPRKATHVAKQTTVTLVDDLDGKKAAEQIEFAVDGKTYEIDLSAANSARLRQALAPFVSAARRTGGRRGSTGGTATSRPTVDQEQNQAIREWAQKRGMKISERGRIPSNVLEAYHQNS
jgi:nucleoid-associated protein Lsr2